MKKNIYIYGLLKIVFKRLLKHTNDYSAEDIDMSIREGNWKSREQETGWERDPEIRLVAVIIEVCPRKCMGSLTFSILKTTIYDTPVVYLRQGLAGHRPCQ